MADVAVLGTGRMGAAAAGRLAAKGHRVTVWNRTPGPARTLAQKSDGRISWAERPDQAVRNCRVVIAMLADGSAVRSVLLEQRVLQSLSSDTVVCDLSTSGPVAATEVGREYASQQRLFLDAPVSGSVAAVAAGQLLVMASGPDSARAAAQSVLADLARDIVVVGVEAGAGQVMKLAVNLVVHDLNVALSESLLLAERAGITRVSAYDVLMRSVVAAPYVHYKQQAFLDPGAPVAMSLDLVAKDLGLIIDLAQRHGLSPTVTHAALAVVRAACAAGRGALDMARLNTPTSSSSADMESLKEDSPLSQITEL